MADAPAYVRGLGFSTDRLPSKTFQGTPMRHGGVHVGNFYLVEKEGGAEFTDADEEVLVLFASQAASAIANARTYRAEQRARADLEALVETSPVGVVVFDVRTGNMVSLNREARRIVEGLRMPGRPVDELLRVLTCRRADGNGDRARPLPPLTGELSSAEAVRAEESRALDPRRAQRHDARQRDADPSRGWRGGIRWWSPCRTWRRSRSSTGCGPSFSAW